MCVFSKDLATATELVYVWLCVLLCVRWIRFVIGFGSDDGGGGDGEARCVCVVWVVAGNKKR